VIALRLERLLGIDQDGLRMGSLGHPSHFGEVVLVLNLAQLLGALDSPPLSVVGKNLRQLLEPVRGLLPLDVAVQRLRLRLEQIGFGPPPKKISEFAE
jgi:hypothetical protein